MPISRRSGTLVLFSLFLFSITSPLFAIDFLNDDLFIYDIRENEGELGDGSWNNDTLDDACDGCWELRIDGSRYDPPGSFTLDGSGREVTFPVQSMSGLDVVRRVYVPQEANFVRYLNVLTNPTGADITVSVEYDTNLGSDSNTTIVATTSGDIIADLADSWAVTNGDSRDPIVSHIWDGLGAMDTVDVLFLSAPGDDDVDWTWDSVTVAPGETKIYMTVGIMSSTSENAVVEVNAAYNQQLPQLTFNMTDDDLNMLQNWLIADTDEDGMPDGYETAFGLDPENAGDAASDNDMDGMVAIDEFNNFTDPTNPDSDGDGLLDGAEFNDLGTNPTKADTDGDGVSDGGEINSGLDPLDGTDVGVDLLLSDGENRSMSPHAYQDGAGNLHVVYSAEVEPMMPANRGGSFRQIFYTLRGGDGSVLIAPTMISEAGQGDDYNLRSQVAATDAGTVYVTWQQRCCSDQLYFKVLDISADDQDGSAADLATIGPDSPILLTTDDINHPALAIDSAGNARVVGSSRCGGDMRHFEIDATGAVLSDDTLFYADSCHQTVDFGLDSADNLHIVYSSNEDPNFNRLSGYQMFYAMVDSGGNILIAPTLLTPDDGQRVKHTTISVDDSDMAHVIFGMGVEPPVRGGGNEPAEVFYTKLDPVQDDLDGDEADPVTITATPITMLTENDGQQSWYMESSMSGGAIQITWNDGGGGRASPVYHMSLNPADGSTTNPILVSSSAVDITNSNYVPFAAGKAILKESIDGVTSIVGRTVVAEPVETATATGIASVNAAGGVAVSLAALNVADLPMDAQSDAPAAIDFVDGLLRVVINGVEEGGSVDMTLTLPTEYDMATDFVFKWDAVNGWVSFPYMVGASPNEIVLTLTDGGSGDADGVANGQIVDPVGPAKNGNTNAPAFTSTPITSVTEGEAYSYTATATDVESGSALTFSGLTVPSWLTFVDNGDGTATLSGTPSASDIGTSAVSLQVDDGSFVPQQGTQSFNIQVASGVVSTSVSGDGGGNGATTPWLLLLGASLLFLRSRRTHKGAQ